MPDLEMLLSRASCSSLREPAPSGDALDLILRSGLCAPDHGHLVPWRFVLIRGEAKRAYADLVVDALRRREPDAPEALLARARDKATAPPLIIVLGARVREDNPKVPAVEQMLTVAAGAMNLLNAIHALGFGAKWVTGANAYDPVVAEALGFRAPDRLAGFLHVGTPDQPASPPPRRASLAEHVRDWTGAAAWAPGGARRDGPLL